MAKTPMEFGDEHRTTTNRYVDARGREIDRTSYEEHETLHDDGSSDVTKDIENRIFPDGAVWNPAHSMRKEKPIDVGLCDACRKLCGAHNLVHCARCGSPRCPRHRVSNSDGATRCPRCSLRFRIRRLLTFVFFKKDDSGSSWDL